MLAHSAIGKVDPLRVDLKYLPHGGVAHRVTRGYGNSYGISFIPRRAPERRLAKVDPSRVDLKYAPNGGVTHYVTRGYGNS